MRVSYFFLKARTLPFKRKDTKETLKLFPKGHHWQFDFVEKLRKWSCLATNVNREQINIYLSNMSCLLNYVNFVSRIRNLKNCRISYPEASVMLAFLIHLETLYFYIF